MASFLWFHLWIPQRTPNQWSPMTHFVGSPILHPRSFHRLFLWAQISSAIDLSFGFAVGSDVTNASTAKTFSVSFLLPSSFSVAFAWIVTTCSENFLSVPDLQAVQFSIFTFHRFVTTGVMVVVFVFSKFPPSLERDHGYDC